MAEPAVAAATQRLTRPLALVGLMGSGKSSVGRRLAGALGAEFVDSAPFGLYSIPRFLSPIRSNAKYANFEVM